MTLDPFLAAPLIVQIHALSALAALPVGAVLLRRRKGTTLHRILGRLWVVLMLVAAISSAMIHQIRTFGPFGPIHILTVLVLLTLVRGLWVLLMRRDIAAHRQAMYDLYVWSLVVAVAFALWPGRLTNQVLFGPEGSVPGVEAVLVLAAASAVAWRYRNGLVGALRPIAVARDQRSSRLRQRPRIPGLTDRT